jgi:NhaP-type Na+/H+ or K+/H+ antiporter
VRSLLSDLPVEITVSLLTPYAAYLPAELFGASGVLAAVTAGLYLGRWASRIMGSDVRLAGRAVWEMLIFLLNGIVFVLLGFQIAALGAPHGQVGADRARRGGSRSQRRADRGARALDTSLAHWRGEIGL